MRSARHFLIPLFLLALACAAAHAQFPTWLQQAELTPTSGERFGAVAISGNLALIGDNDYNSTQGAAYVLENDGGTWTQQAVLTASDGVAGDLFGLSVAISGNIAAVGSDKSINGNEFQGAVYIFVNSGGAWTQQAELTDPDGNADEGFGARISLDGNTLLVGAPGRSNGTVGGGAIFFYFQNDEAWTQQAQFLGQNIFTFGASVSVNGNTALIGAPQGNQTGDGLAYIYVRNGTTWTFQQALEAPDASPSNDLFGDSVSLSGNLALIGAPDKLVGEYNDCDPPECNVGAAYAFARSGSAWSFQQELIATDGTPSDHFGYSVALSGTAAIVGDTNGTPPFRNPAGDPVYFFQQRNGDSWEQAAELFPPSAPAQADFGLQISLSGNFALVGDPGGAAYVFENLESPLQNASFEQGSSTPVSLSGSDVGGPSAASIWGIWNNASGTTTTELCSTTCPSGSTPPTPNQGAYTLHVKTTSAYAGIYQVFPPTALVGGSLWLHIVSGSVYVNLFGDGVSAPAGNVGATSASSGTLVLPVNGQKFNELVIYSNGVPAEFYMDAVDLVPPPLTNSAFTHGSSSQVQLTGTGNLGASAATGWNVANGVSGTTTTELCTNTCPSGAAPPAPVAGSHMLHVTTTGASSGVYQAFPETTPLSSGLLWLNIVSGPVTVTLQGPSGPMSLTATHDGAFFLPANGGLFNEIDIDSSSEGPSDFFVNAESLMPTLATIANPSFEAGSSTLVTFTGLDYGGSSAATGWPVWDDESGTTTTELCSATCPSGATPPPPVAGSYTLHVKTTATLAASTRRSRSPASPPPPCT